MTASDTTRKLATIAATAASDKLAEEIAVIDVSQRLVITEIFVICSAASERQVTAIVDEVEDKLREDGNVKPVRREGTREGRWALLDYGDLVIHVFRAEEREFYGLDRLWRDCPLVDIEGIDTPIRPESWSSLPSALTAHSIDELPLAETEPDADEL